MNYRIEPERLYCFAGLGNLIPNRYKAVCDDGNAFGGFATEEEAKQAAVEYIDMIDRRKKENDEFVDFCQKNPTVQFGIE